MPEAAPANEALRVRRHPERGRYDAETINAILDEGLVCHLGVVIKGRPHVVPTLYARVDDTLYVHGALANRALNAMRSGSPVSLVVTLLDGLVMARSAFNHSLNYRSVVVMGQALEVTDPATKLAAMEALVEQVAAGRWAETRPPNQVELDTTVILAISLSAASAKVRVGPPIDNAEDVNSRHWAGVVPLRMEAGEPVPAPDLAGPQQPPEYARNYRGGGPAKEAE